MSEIIDPIPVAKAIEDALIARFQSWRYQRHREAKLREAIQQALAQARASGLSEAAQMVQNARGKYDDIPVRNVKQLLKAIEQQARQGEGCQHEWGGKQNNEFCKRCHVSKP
jgi:hypothetical protein